MVLRKAGLLGFTAELLILIEIEQKLRSFFDDVCQIVYFSVYIIIRHYFHCLFNSDIDSISQEL